MVFRTGGIPSPIFLLKTLVNKGISRDLHIPIIICTTFTLCKSESRYIYTYSFTFCLSMDFKIFPFVRASQKAYKYKAFPSKQAILCQFLSSISLCFVSKLSLKFSLLNSNPVYNTSNISQIFTKALFLKIICINMFARICEYLFQKIYEIGLPCFPISLHVSNLWNYFLSW